MMFVRILAIGVFTIAAINRMPSASATPAAALDSVYIKIVECYVPPAAFVRYSQSNVEFLFGSSKDSVYWDSLLTIACTTVGGKLMPEKLLKTRLGTMIADSFNVNDAAQILQACSKGEGFTDKNLYERFNSFMTTFQQRFESESEIVWLKYLGAVSNTVADLAESATSGKKK